MITPNIAKRNKEHLIERLIKSLVVHIQLIRMNSTVL